MLLTEVAEAVTELLNSSPEKWCGDEDLRAKEALDWITCLRKTELQVLIVPDSCAYNLENVSARRRQVLTETTKTVVVMIAKGFIGLDTDNDVAPWSESKELLNIRERISQFLLANPIEGLKIVNLEEVAVDELEIDHRNFMAMSQISYQVIQCGSGPGLLSS